MTKVTEGEISGGGQDVGKSNLDFPILAKGYVRQDSVNDFVASYSEGEFIALSGSKTEVVTLELSSKFVALDPFPYLVAYLECNASEPRPLDVLASQVNLEAIYDTCDVLEAQHLALEPAYTAVCSVSVPATRLVAVKRSPKLLPNGNLLLGSLNSYGFFTLMSKPAEYNRWSRLEELNVSVVLRDTLLPEQDISNITSFKKYQAFINRAWITMFAWLPDNSETNGHHILVLATASGSLWTLNLSADAKTILSHQEVCTSLGRICYIDAFKDLLLLGDINGLIHLYKFVPQEIPNFVLTKALWEKADRMGLQNALITECPVKNCYYITCSKASHVLTWCMPRSEEKQWLATRLYVGGMKITGLCSLGNNSFAVGSAGSHLHRIQIFHEDNQLRLQMQSIPMAVLQDFPVMGLCTSRHKNLMTMFVYRNKEFINQNVAQRKHMDIQVVKVRNEDALAQLISHLEVDKPINYHTDFLAELRLDVFVEANWQRYIDFSPLNSFTFSEPATETQLQQLQVKFHVLQSVLRLQTSLLQLTVHVKKSQDEMKLLLAMLSITHIRLRLQFIGTLSQRTTFQQQTTKCMFEESRRMMNKLKSDFSEEHPLGSTTKAFVEEIGKQLKVLHNNLGNPVIGDPLEKPLLRCSVSFVEISPSLDRRYCSICERSILFELENLQELYDLGRILTCPICHGSFAVEMLTA
ncbi:uncharacterized protein LOC108038173 [Drosophila rhopaloa]|uniref:Uncharacterized protein LOC108038173 n=1 Tax=Drosophila rhopaloa TaxID=1041015 RepID=A0A6P4DY11_DRORH|nr:uncharacterized protein LOC108038173 [Drosophila rhopaloa]